MAENAPKVEVKVIPAAPAPPTKSYKVKPGAKLYVGDLGRYAYDNEVVQLTDVAAHAFRDKLVPTPQLGAVVQQVQTSEGNDKLLTPDKRSDATEEAARAAQAAAAAGPQKDGSTPPPQGRAPQTGTVAPPAAPVK